MHFYNVSIIDSFQCTMFESSKKMVFVCCSSSDFISSASAQYPTIFSFSFLVKVRVVFSVFSIGIATSWKVVLLTISFTGGSSIECIKGVAWAWHPYIG